LITAYCLQKKDLPLPASQPCQVSPTHKTALLLHWLRLTRHGRNKRQARGQSLTGGMGGGFADEKKYMQEKFSERERKKCRRGSS
ncbi:MAG: hypothetical protein Q8R21_02630, partial [Burkholderiales bacterium]|nr:hypothetical protein [Burkholderiales bacterium]